MQEFLNRVTLQNEARIDLDQNREISYWSQQWAITPKQLYKAVQATGSNCVKEIKEYLRGKGFAL
ncbi:MAG TPA: DUF3606 domain-containing protein [Flavitalea sp.]|nr:DUF3606 domain-containing protein [Flavitalea sp.]